MKKTKNKVLVIGAGPVGCTVSNILAKENFEITIIDQRNHIAGNCYDEINKKGILVHKYGPHYFRTNKKMIVNYLSNYTKWIKGNYFVRSVYKKKHYDFPININTLQKFFKRKFTKTEAKNFLKKKSIKKKNIDNFESYLISKMGQDLYEAFYKNYTIKQWNIDPRKLSVKVAKRIPIYFDKTRSYFKSKFMIMPKNGFTKMFYNMTNSQNIFIRLNTKYKQSMKKKFDIIIYTGPVDLFFNYKFGKLEWRSLDFKFITKKKNFFARSGSS